MEGSIITSYDEVTDSLMSQMGRLANNLSKYFIYRVPQRMRSKTEEAYVPRVVSIGPYHHGKDDLQAMEQEKMRYLEHFLRRQSISSNSHLTLQHYITKVRDREKILRSCYEGDIRCDSDKFVRIILLDAVFIIEILLISLEMASSGYSQVENDRIFNKPWMIVDVLPDLLLLENQLPFFILLELFDQDIHSSRGQSLFSLARNFLINEPLQTVRTVGVKDDLITETSSDPPVAHFLDLVRFLCVPLMLQKEIKPEGKRQYTVRTITELYQAGVKFKVGSTNCLFDIRFRNGILEIPKIEISYTTESLLRNLIAFEECHEPWNNIVSMYALTMDRFVNTVTDVQLLVKEGIIENMLGDNWDVARMFNRLGAGVSAKGYNTYYDTLYNHLNAHCKMRWNGWMANLKIIYFDTPWTTIKVIAAVVLLILTLIQTVCSIISVI